MCELVSVFRDSWFCYSTSSWIDRLDMPFCNLYRCDTFIFLLVGHPKSLWNQRTLFSQLSYSWFSSRTMFPKYGAPSIDIKTPYNPQSLDLFWQELMLNPLRGGKFTLWTHLRKPIFLFHPLPPLPTTHTLQQCSTVSLKTNPFIWRCHCFVLFSGSRCY